MYCTFGHRFKRFEKFKDSGEEKFISGHIFVFLGAPMSGKSILSRMIEEKKKVFIEDDFVCEKKECQQLINDIYMDRPENLIIITHGCGYDYETKKVKYQPEQLLDRLKELKEIGYNITVCNFERV